jgi:hypothetical protein
MLKELADRGLVVSYYALWHFLQHEGVTFKKSLRASEQDRPDVARRRKRWKARQATIDPRRLVFIDASAVGARHVGFGPGLGAMRSHGQQRLSHLLS